MFVAWITEIAHLFWNFTEVSVEIVISSNFNWFHQMGYFGGPVLESLYFLRKSNDSGHPVCSQSIKMMSATDFLGLHLNFVEFHGISWDFVECRGISGKSTKSHWIWCNALVFNVILRFMWSGSSWASQNHQYSYRNIKVSSTGPPGTHNII